MLLEIKCPECGKKSQTAYERVPKGRLKTTCHGCTHQFHLDKERGTNCCVVRPQEGPVYAENGWKVEHPACQGMDYDLEGVKGLIRSGMIGRDTRVLPPGERGYRGTATIPQLKPSVEQWEKKNEGR